MLKIALVTGGSRGIGAATAIKLAEQGYSLGINYRNDGAAAMRVVEKIQSMGQKAVAIKADIASEEDVIRLFSLVDEQLGPVSLVVNNAGVLFKQSDIEQMTAERINKTFQINVTGCFLCCREAVKRMSKKHHGAGGVIVNVSSMAARLGSPHEYIDYAASKGAVDTLTVGLAMEVAEQGIRVNGVRPGLIDTEIHASGGEPDRLERVTPYIPMKRGGEPEEVAEAIVWLASEKSAYTTGSFIDVAGGR